MTACQLLFVDRQENRTVLDLLPLEPLVVDRETIPAGSPVAVGLGQPSDASTYEDLVGTFVRWEARTSFVDVAIKVRRNRVTYVFRADGEQLVLDVDQA